MDEVERINRERVQRAYEMIMFVVFVTSVNYCELGKGLAHNCENPKIFRSNPLARQICKI